jgi:PAS domain S-box-containing protein
MASPAPPCQIVLIDDEADIREVTALTLEDRGYRVATAADGPAGLQLVFTLAPQIVITDIRMPGMDGLQVLETIKQRQPEIEVIVATAFGEMDVAIRALQLDASDFITKPIHDEALQLALRRAQERYRSRRELADYLALLEKEKAETSQELVRIFSFQKRLIESSMDGILACDAADLVVSCNRSMEQLTGWSREELLSGKRLEDLLPGGEAQRLKRLLAGETHGGPGRLYLFETAVVGRLEHSIPVQVSAAALQPVEAEQGLVCFFRDLREIRRLEQEVADQARILHQDKMMSLGRLAASVVHEINNPLSGILNYLELMTRVLERGGLNPEQQGKFQHYLHTVLSETKRCASIVSSLLAFARKSPPSVAALDIAALLERCRVLSQHRLELGGITLDFQVEPGLPPVQGDANQLQQVVINLIFNAIDAMPGGGRLRIRAYHDAAPSQVAIVVADSGAGIAPEVLPHIFEPFFTTKREGHGVGLGLSTVFGIIERHHGSVEVQSRPGDGAVFTIRLPIQAHAP